jgi:type II secretory pathway component PulK
MSGASRGRGKRSVVGPSKYVSASMVEVGSILYLSKSNPSPMARLNPYVNINPVNGDIIRNPKYIELLDRLDELLD